MSAVKGAALAGLIVLALVTLLALLAGCDTKRDADFRQQCEAKGGTPQITHRGNSTTRICLMPSNGRNG